MADYREGIAAEFDSEASIVSAARALQEQGYRALDALTPRPIDDLQDIVAPRRSTLPRTVLAAGLTGTLVGLGVQWWCNAWDYPINVGGRPPFSLPAFVPITFEIMVLFAALATFFGVLRRMYLPRLAHPVFDVPGIESASIDRFWLLVLADDRHPDDATTERLLAELGGEQITRLPVAEGAPA